MPVVKQRKVWTRQPQIITGIDWSNPITQGLIGCWTPGLTLLNHVTKQFAPVSGPLNSAVSAEGVALEFESNRYVTAMRYQDLPGDYGLLSVFCVFYCKNPTASGDDKRIFGCHDSGKGFTMEVNSSGQAQFVFGSVNGWQFMRNDTAVKSGEVIVVVASRPAAGVQSYGVVNGRFIQSGNPAGYLASAKDVWMGNSQNYGGGWAGGGGILLAGVVARAYTEQECISLAANPWQIFRP